MRAGPFFGGIVIIALGLLLLLFGTQIITIDVPHTETKTLFDTSTLTVGDTYQKSAELAANLTVRCSGSVKIPSSNESGDISFYVMDRGNFEKWHAGDRTVDFMVQKPTISKIDVSFITAHADTYYFVFDNTYSPLFKKEVTFTASFEYTTIQHETREDRTLNNYGYPIAIVGAILMIYGLIRKPEVRWA